MSTVNHLEGNSTHYTNDVDVMRRGKGWLDVHDPQTRWVGSGQRVQQMLRSLLVKEYSRPKNVVVFMDGSVRRGVKSRWAYSDGSGAFAQTTSSTCVHGAWR